MPIIQLPDGQKVSVPDDATPEMKAAFKAKLAQKYNLPAPQQPITPDATTQPQPSRGYAATQLLDDLGAGLKRGANQLAVGAQQAYDALPSMNPFPLSDKAKALQQRAVGIDVLTGKPLEQRAAELRRTENTPTVNYFAAGIPEMLLNAPAKTLKSAIVLNSLLAALQPTTKDESRAENAAFSGAATAATGLIGKALGKGIDAIKLARMDLPSFQVAKAQSSAAYDKAAEIAPTIKASFFDDFVQNVKDDILPKTDLGKAVAGDKDAVYAVLDNLDALKGQDVPYQAFKEFDQNLTALVRDSVDNTGKQTPVGRDFVKMQSAFRKKLDDITPEQVNGDVAGYKAYKEARKLANKYKKLDDIEFIIQKGANNGDNEAQALKTGFRTLANNRKNLYGYTPNEITAIRKAANSSPTADALKTLGNRLIPIGNAVSGGGAGGFIATKLGGDVAREGAAFGQGLRAKNVLATINNNGQALPDSKTAEIARRLGHMTGGALNRSQSQEGQ